jgi:hypothetical protein
LQGVLGRSSVLEPCRAFERARLVILDQDVCLLLMTDELFDEVRQDTAEPGLPGFWKLPTGFDRVLARWSIRGPVAYVEADYFCGVGTQAAVVCDAGLVLGPVVEPERPLAPYDSSRSHRRCEGSAYPRADTLTSLKLSGSDDTATWRTGTKKPSDRGRTARQHIRFCESCIHAGEGVCSVRDLPWKGTQRRVVAALTAASGEERGGRVDVVGCLHSPVAPSMASRMRSAWPLCRAYSSSICR